MKSGKDFPPQTSTQNTVYKISRSVEDVKIQMKMKMQATNYKRRTLWWTREEEYCVVSS